MARIDILKEIYCKKRLIKDFDFDKLFHYPISYYLNANDIIRLRYLATSAKWSSKQKKDKIAEINSVMNPRGFKWFATGTNRIIYKNEYDQSFLIKVAFDSVGMKDNPDEFYNQGFVKPFVAKTFDVSPCGTVSLVERVNPIANRFEFEDIAGEIFDILHNFFVGKYILEDIGTDFFKNWGIRDGFGPVLLDFPYLYETDGDKLQCIAIYPNGQHCDGIIDYDNGLNTLVCEKCNKRYSARSLGKVNHIKSIKNKIIEEDSNMESEILVSVVKNGKEYKLYSESDCIAPNAYKQRKRIVGEDNLTACVIGGYIKKAEPTKTDNSHISDIVKKQLKEFQIQTDTVVSVTVQSPDVIEQTEFVEVPPKHFKSPDKNSELEFQDESIEKDFADEAKKEQQELEDNEAKAVPVVNAKERALMNRFMTTQMKKFQFGDYTEPSQTQRTDMIDYLIVAVTAKYTLDPEIAVMAVSEFVDTQYHFEAEKTDIAKAEDLAKKYYGDKSYECEDSIEPMAKRSISKEF